MILTNFNSTLNFRESISWCLLSAIFGSITVNIAILMFKAFHLAKAKLKIKSKNRKYKIENDHSVVHFSVQDNTKVEDF